MRVDLRFSIEVPEGTDPAFVVQVANSELDSGGDILCQWGDWSPSPAELVEAALTKSDRRVMTKAGALAALGSAAAVRGHVGDSDPLYSYVAAFGEAQELLRALAAIITRLTEGEAVADRRRILERLWAARCELSPEVIRDLDAEALAVHLRDCHPEGGGDEGES